MRLHPTGLYFEGPHNLALAAFADNYLDRTQI